MAWIRHSEIETNTFIALQFPCTQPVLNYIFPLLGWNSRLSRTFSRIQLHRDLNIEDVGFFLQKAKTKQTKKERKLKKTELK